MTVYVTLLPRHAPVAAAVARDARRIRRFPCSCRRRGRDKTVLSAV